MPADGYASCVFYGDLYPNGECYDAPTAQGLRLLLRARKDFAYGLSKDYLEHRSCIGFVRMGDDSHSGCAVLISKNTQQAGYVRMIIMRHFCLPSLGPYFTGSTPNDHVLYE
jgi:alpha-amylase